MTQWKLVPVEPTEEMLGFCSNNWRNYAGILAAAPQPPSEPDGYIATVKYEGMPLDFEFAATYVEAVNEHILEAISIHQQNELEVPEYHVRSFYLHPPIPTVPDEEVTGIVETLRRHGRPFDIEYKAADLIERLATAQGEK